MKKPTLLGSVVSVLLAFSVISHARTYVQQQSPKPVQQTNQTVSNQANTPAEATRPETPVAASTVTGAPEIAPAGARTSAPSLSPGTVLPGEIYSATAYSLRGRTASGRPVARGMIAADPRVLPIGTRVRLEAGAWTGEYIVTDTGGAVRGRRIDIWTPTAGEALRFGRRAVKLTILELAGKRAKSATARQRVINSPNPSSSTESQTTRQ
jgi:3D (Asp-Asp-Asp) domain-containing protein